MQAVERRRTAFVEATGLGRSRKLDQKQKGDGIVRRPEGPRSPGLYPYVCSYTSIIFPSLRIKESDTPKIPAVDFA